MGNFMIYLLGGLLGFLFGLAAAAPTISKIIQIHRTSSFSMDKIPDNTLREFTGNVRSDGRSLQSPLTQTACVLWHVEIEESKSSGEDSHWETVFNETSAHPFELRDHLGILRIYPRNAELILRNDLYRECGPFVGTFEPTLNNALEKLRISPVTPLGLTKPLRVREQVIKADETVYVLGNMEEQSGIRVISSSKGSSPFLISDRSQSTLLITLYLRVVSSIILLTVFGAYVVPWIASQK